MTCGFKIRTSKDFERLASDITVAGVGYISVSSLKRIWGYVKDSGGKNIATLDVIARYAGYPRGFLQFSETIDTEEVESGYDRKRVLDVLRLKQGAFVRVEWLPDRIITLKHENDAIFVVTESVNAKLKTGMRVKCPRIVENEKLIVELVNDSSRRWFYEAGRNKGVVWKILDPCNCNNSL